MTSREGSNTWRSGSGRPWSWATVIATRVAAACSTGWATLEMPRAPASGVSSKPITSPVGRPSLNSRETAASASESLVQTIAVAPAASSWSVASAPCWTLSSVAALSPCRSRPAMPRRQPAQRSSPTPEPSGQPRNPIRV